MAAATAPHQLAVHVTSFDSEEVANGWANIKLVVVPRPTPQRGEALVRITARALNPSDLIRAAGRYGPAAHPFVVGGEGVGVVEQGSGLVGGIQRGERVVATAWPGSWQEYAVVPEDKLVVVPDDVHDRTAAQAWINPVTALGLLDVSAVPKGQWLLHSAAASVLGRILIQLATHCGIRTISVVRREEQVGELQGLGATVVINSTAEDVVARVKEVTDGEGAYAAIDHVNGEFAGVLMRALRKGGTLRIAGLPSGDTTTIQTVDMRAGEKTLQGFMMGQWVASQGPGAAKRLLEEALRLIVDYVISPFKGASYPLDRVHEAIAASEKPERKGKVVLTS